MRSRGKVVDDFENELKPAPKPKAGGSKTTKSKAKSEPSFTTDDVSNILLLKDETTRKILGILMICFSLFSMASLISFALYWKNDLSILQGNISDPYQAVNNFDIKNWMGVLGANFGHILMYKGFGLLSLLVPVFLMHYGLLLLVDKKIINPVTWLKYIATAGIWFMLASGSLFYSFSPVLGGGVGFWMFSGISEMLGLFGALLILAVTAYAIMWLIFKYEPIGIKNYAQKLIPGMVKPAGEEYNDDDETQVYAGDTLFEKDRIELDNFEEDDEETQEFSFTIVEDKGKKKLRNIMVLIHLMTQGLICGIISFLILIF